jgi:osmotically-inducible protein OsmY
MKTQTKQLSLLLCIAVPYAVSPIFFMGCAGNRYERSTGQYIDDKSLTIRVHDALADSAEYKFSDVNVRVFRSTVQLSGFVNSSEQKTRAGEIARNVQGVGEVQNNITVKER